MVLFLEYACDLAYRDWCAPEAIFEEVQVLNLLLFRLGKFSGLLNAIFLDFLLNCFDMGLDQLVVLYVALDYLPLVGLPPTEIEQFLVIEVLN